MLYTKEGFETALKARNKENLAKKRALKGIVKQLDRLENMNLSVVEKNKLADLRMEFFGLANLILK